jgi:GNAT superfamily N-acetyltransferase
MSSSTLTDVVTIRTSLRPGDLGAIVQLHGTIYAREYGFDPTFEAYVAGPLADFVRLGSDRERLWIAENDDQIVGCIAIVAATTETAQLRWYLVDPAARGIGLGKKLLHEAILFCKGCGYRTIILWTVQALAAAAHLYTSAGFRKVEEKPGKMWGVDVVEEKYALELTACGVAS